MGHPRSATHLREVLVPHVHVVGSPHRLGVRTLGGRQAKLHQQLQEAAPARDVKQKKG
jgi:hypothetical protein